MATEELEKQAALFRDALRDFDDRAYDLTGAGPETFDDALSRFSNLFGHQTLIGRAADKRLPLVQFDQWYAGAKLTCGSFPGTGRLTWPTDPPSRLAMQVELMRRLNSRSDFKEFRRYFLGGFSWYEGIHNFEVQFLRPFLRDFKYLLEQEKLQISERPESTASEAEQAQEAHPVVQGIRLFISHSSIDTELAKALIHLFRAALNLEAKAIRCTSVDGYRLAAGAQTSSQLRREILGATAFVGVLSEASLRSAFVLFELGARWGAGMNLTPLLAHGTHPSVLKKPLDELNALTCDSEKQLYQLVSDLGDQLDIDPQPVAAFVEELRVVLTLQSATTLSADATTRAPTAAVAQLADASLDQLRPVQVEMLKTLVRRSLSEFTLDEIEPLFDRERLRTRRILDELEDRGLVTAKGRGANLRYNLSKTALDLAARMKFL